MKRSDNVSTKVDPQPPPPPAAVLNFTSMHHYSSAEFVTFTSQPGIFQCRFDANMNEADYIESSHLFKICASQIKFELVLQCFMKIMYIPFVLSQSTCLTHWCRHTAICQAHCIGYQSYDWITVIKSMSASVILSKIVRIK